VKLKLLDKEKTALLELKDSIEQKYKLLDFKLFGSITPFYLSVEKEGIAI
jgi:hypothetical protein